MTSPPNIAAIPASLELSFHNNCSLNHRPSASTSSAATALKRSSSSDDDAALKLNSHASRPHHWEHCLDIKTGEVYYKNSRNGTRSTEDPRLTTTEHVGGFCSSEVNESCYDGEESSSESSPSPSKDDILVVAGCKICLMYFMVAERVEDCSKCGGRLIHFDRSYNLGSP